MSSSPSFQCPRCKKRLSIDGSWATCTCEFADDIVAIQADRWKCGLAESASNLKLDRHLRAVEQRAGWKTFLQQADLHPPCFADQERFFGMSMQWSPGIVAIGDMVQLGKLIKRPISITHKDDSTALVIPFYLSPGRVIGLLVYFTVEGKLTPKYIPFEKTDNAGMCLLSRTPPDFVFAHPVDAVVAAMRWRSNHQKNLPVVGCWVDASRHSFATCLPAGAKPFVIADNASDEAIIVGCELQRPIATDHTLPTTVGAELAWLKKAITTKTSWTGLLRNLWNRSPDKAAQLFPRLHKKHVELCRKDIPAELLIAAVELTTTASDVIQTADGWRTRCKQAFVCNCNLFVDQVVTTESKTYYRGRAVNATSKHTFIVSATDVDSRGLLLCVRDALRKQAVPFELQYSTSYSARSWAIACQMQAPTSAKGSDKIGWNPPLDRFQLANFAINGTNTIYETCLDDKPPTSELVPALSLPPIPNGLKYYPLWQAVTLLLYHIVCPAIQDRPGLTVIETDDIPLCERLFLLLGAAGNRNWQHDWPVVTSDTSALKSMPDNHILVCDSLAAWSGCAAGARRIVINEPKAVVDKELRHTCLQIAPAYLQHFCRLRRDGQIDIDSLESVMASLSCWPGTPTITSEEHPNRYEAIVQVVHQLWQRSPESVVIKLEDGVLWFSGEKILKELREKSLPVIPLEKLRVAFEKFVGYADEIPVNGTSLEIGVKLDRWMVADPDRVVSARKKFGLFS